MQDAQVPCACARDLHLLHGHGARMILTGFDKTQQSRVHSPANTSRGSNQRCYHLCHHRVLPFTYRQDGCVTRSGTLCCLVVSLSRPGARLTPVESALDRTFSIGIECISRSFKYKSECSGRFTAVCTTGCTASYGCTAGCTRVCELRAAVQEALRVHGPRQKCRDEEAGGKEPQASLAGVVVHPHNRASAVVLRLVEAHLATAEQLVPITAGLVHNRRKAIDSSAALARFARPRLRHGLPTRAEMVGLAVASLDVHNVR